MAFVGVLVEFVRMISEESLHGMASVQSLLIAKHIGKIDVKRRSSKFFINSGR